ncbi:hypothetical protein TNCV_2207221 [Trichonephila clavipes]|uniref:Uncharacterized protein n=1 Tax=Trichonephila clavipes TaxID=2585209 RepID=A0A8X6S2K6_TRICX|nr:hypothetical protein TNCV_2207221 [Trichonephila clavipes]
MADYEQLLTEFINLPCTFTESSEVPYRRIPFAADGGYHRLPFDSREEEDKSRKAEKQTERGGGSGLNANSSPFPNANGMLICPSPGKIALFPEK